MTIISGSLRGEFSTKVTQIGKSSWTVEVSFSHLPFDYAVHFVERHEDDRLAMVCESVTIVVSGGVVRDSLIRDFAGDFGRYESIARAAVAAVRANGGEIASPPVRRQRKLTPTFLAEIVRRHDAHAAAGRPPTATLAAEEGVTVGAVKNWLRRARKAGIETS